MDSTTSQLIAIVNTPGYRILLAIFEEQNKRLEQAVFEIDPADAARVLSAQQIAVGARWALREAVAKVDRITQAATTEQKPMTREEEEQLYLKSLN